MDGDGTIRPWRNLNYTTCKVMDLSDTKLTSAANTRWTGERRRRARLPLHWEIQLIRADGSIFAGIIENLSSNGFYCFTIHYIRPGEELDCHVSMPSNKKTDVDLPVVWLCRARAIRTEADGQGRYGIAFAIEKYQIVPEG
jgi:hypothetical protein